MSLPDLFSRTPDTHTVYFMRHGESEGNVGGILQGRLDYPLTPRGVHQAEAAARWFGDRSIDLVLSSPQSRAKQTADIVHRTIRDAGRSPRLEYVSDLVEVNLGCFSGLTMVEARTRYPEIHKNVHLDTWDAVPDAEHSAELRERSKRVWSLILDSAGTCTNVLVVSHGGFLQWLIKTSIGADDTGWQLRFHSSNCGIHECVLSRRSSERVIVEWKRINLVVSPTEGAERNE